MPFNTVYQLMATRRDHPEAFAKAERLLMLPEYLNFLLTGQQLTEYTNASTTAMLDARAKNWDEELIRELGLPRHIFGEIRPAGTPVGTLLPSIAQQVGFSCEVIAPATHDTGSAVVSAPVGENSIFLSSGTWSLIGVELREPLLDEKSERYNFTNEGGAEYAYRYLKNLTGLWMIQNLRAEHGNLPFPELARMAKTELGYPGLVLVDDVAFKAPENMTRAIREALGEEATLPELLACVYNSLADSYRQAVDEMRETTGRAFERICIVGGGCQDDLLNQLTANATGLSVTAGPIEATALGNIIVQMITSGEIENIAKAREIIKASFPMRAYAPTDAK
jgi:rhamnulokinase